MVLHEPPPVAYGFPVVMYPPADRDRRAMAADGAATTTDGMRETVTGESGHRLTR